MRELILRCALQNAINYNGKANLNSVLGLVFSLDKNLDKKNVVEETKKIVNEVNSMSLEKQKQELDKLGEIKKKEKIKQEEKLENVHGKVIVRFAPNPNGALSFGHCRPALWNWFFARKYKGKYILRMDDTDPRIKTPLKEAYGWIKKDLEWLGVKPNKFIIQSKRLKMYYKYAEKLIKMGRAYVDTMPVDKMRELLWNSKISDEREETPEVVLKKWKKMFTKYNEGGAVLRIKTDVDHPNPAVRDWVAFRIITSGKHPLVKARVWPLLNFASAIDDYEFGTTHILRGIDLEGSDERQKFIYHYFGWKYPETKYHGKFFISGIRSTSESNELIKEGKLSGWDDPRLGTIMALKRRGFQAEAIVNFIKDIGINKNDINVNMSNLERYNKKIIDKKALRYFFVENQKKIKIKNQKIKEVKIPSHPDFPKYGSRRFKLNDEFYVQDEIKFDTIYRLIHLVNFKNYEVISEVYDPSLKAIQIHWLPVSKDVVNVEIIMPDGSIKRGLGESGLRNVKINGTLQMERFGFCRVDKKLKNKIVLYYGHN